MWFLAYFLVHLVIYTLLRVEFLVWNRASFGNLSSSELTLAFLNGFRFDLSALAALVGVCLLFLPWLARSRLLTRVWLFLFLVLNSVFILINVADVELFNFTAKRFSSSSFYLLSDAHVSNLIAPYLPLAKVSILILILYCTVVSKLVLTFRYSGTWKKNLGLSLSVLVISIIFSRGGFQLKPLTFVDAKIFNNAYANNLVLNSTFTVLKSATKNSLMKSRFFEQAELLALLNRQDIEPAKVNLTRPNIVVVILESFSQEYSELRNPEVMPYFNRLRSRGVDFKKSYANGRRSIEGIAAILSGIPALMEEPFINSEFSANQVIGLGTILRAHGYSSSFFHGTNLGSMHFDSFTKSVGIDKYYSRDDYPGKSDFDGTWGVFDEPFLQWTCSKLSENEGPFFSAIFTLSSHQPYAIPEKYKARFTDQRLEILKGIQYSDYSLEQFMNCAEKQPWYKNTVFIFTADHTGPALKEDGDFKARYEVPLVIFHGDSGVLKGVDPGQTAQHIDILPTILDILQIENKNKNYLSRSLLRAGPKIVALYSDGRYELAGDVKDQAAQLKAVQQYFSEGMYDNRLYYPAK